MNGSERWPDEGWSKPKPEHIPDPSYWPVLVALGISLAAMGLVMVWVVIVFGGAIAAVGLIGWIGGLTRDG